MFNQSGISQLTLYDAFDTTFDRVTDTEITNVQGTSLIVDSESNPTLRQEVAAINRSNLFSYTFDFVVFGLVNASQYRNTFGWLVLIDFLDGERRFLNTPAMLQDTGLNTNETNYRAIQLKPDRPTVKTLKVQ